MAFTLSTAVTEVRAILNEATAAFWTDTEIENWIKEACTDISTKGGIVTADDTISLVTNQLSYTSSDEAFIADILKTYAVYSTNSTTYKGLVKSHPRMLGNNDILVPGAPRYYCLFNKTFYVMPIPNSTWNAKTLTVLYTKISDDITDLEYEYQKLAIQYATGKAKMKDKQFQEANFILQDYYNSLNFEKSDKTERDADSLDMYQIPKTSKARVKEEI
jgi:hypothetical protein